ncbi:phenylalanine--tRNA ligase subunit beta [Shouchella lehensis]|uniref:Phenylalanine--tRNA ligase beta subunit n=1 Tax=Shouchella lehensis TaxID=300825 RepID=A0A4Y7WR22_9BACI|nr:phenylalanine--tRNA ligase subunit beta [Shouchella lehensis]MBG9783957.1 phenylalanyl-tRNA synthase subunit beta [Shouchella lehensis]TES51075.1 phenylalanine--tRNA ligase subunit beta [Shouchella lehensis]
MLVSYEWIQDYIEIDDITPEEIAEKMTRSGIEIDFIHNRNSGATNIVVGYVKAIEQHPDADKLNVCQVDIGEEEPVQIVCGAPNVDAGQYVAVAKVGARLPGNVKIKKAKLRGQLSQGMICSLQELGIEGKLVPKRYAEGIYVFSEDAAVNPGDDVLTIMALNDRVLELDLTANRSDCMHMIGVAYELAALYDRPVKLPKAKVREIKEMAEEHISVQVDHAKDTPFYQALVIKNVQVGPSPAWLQNRLMAAGIRPISNVVDVTNYVLLEYGQPLHAFDFHALGTGEIHVRRAYNDESFTTLDGIERTLSEEQLVITNGKEPVALAGVMGGLDSEVTDSTTTIVLEAASFAPALVRKSSKLMNLRSDASARFEKGVNESRIGEAARRAAYLIQDLAGGQVLNGDVTVDHRVKKETTISLNLEQMNHRLGTSLSISEVANIMGRLQLPCEKVDHDLVVTIPERRKDLVIKQDLYEEVARIHGYDNIPSTLPIGTTTQGKRSPKQLVRSQIRRVLSATGLADVISYSLTSPAKATRFVEDVYRPIRIDKPMSEERSVMRTSLLPHLYDIAAHNRNHRNQDLFIYELGSVFLTTEERLTVLPREEERVAGLISGTYLNHMWQGEKKQSDFFLLKGMVEQLFASLGLTADVTFKQTEQADFHPGRTATILLKGEPIGIIGQVHPALEDEWHLDESYAFELTIEPLFNQANQMVLYQGVPKFPSIGRDIALVVDQHIPVADLTTVIEEAGGSLLKQVNLFDLYEGEHLEDGKKSVAFSLTYRHNERTLTDEEVQEQHEQVLEALTDTYQATLRS